MNKSSEHREKDFLLTFSDLLNVIKKNKSIILNMSILCACLGLGFGLLRPVEYRVEASFKEKGRSQSGLNQSLSALLLNADSHESEAMTMMRSRMLLEKMVQAEGLQATVKKKEFALPNTLKKIKDNIISEYANFRNLNYPIISSLIQPIKVDNITYRDEIPMELVLAFNSPEDYQVTKNKAVLGQGKIGVPFSTENFTFTLHKTAPGLELAGYYNLTLSPLGKTAQQLAKKFTVESDRLDNSLLKISYKHPNKYQAVAHVNALMDQFKNHVHCEHQQACNLQIAYLQEKQSDMNKQLEELMQAHANNLSTDLSTTGFADYTAAMNFLTINQNNYKQKLQLIALETQWLNQVQKEGKNDFDKLTSIQNPEIINQLTKDISRLKHDAHVLELTTGKFKNSNLTSSSNTNSESFQGIDLGTAKELYIAYSKELNVLEAEEAQHNYIIQQINLPDFEISSLSSVLSDPISVEIISKASPHVLALKDQDNRTSKEQERLKAGLQVQKNFFLSHLNQTNELLQLRQKLIKEKINALQNTHLNLVLEEISILESQMADYIEQRLNTLKHEKSLYEQNLAELRAEMANLPHKWVAEQTIHQQMEINQNMIEQISKLVESKNLASNLEKTQSTSVDLPLLPMHPHSPHLLLLTLAGALGGAFLGTGWAIAKSISRGIEVSSENLRFVGQHVCGTLSSQSCLKNSSLLLDSDLETLRRMISFITQHNGQMSEGYIENTVLLLCGRGPHYVDSLAELMYKMGYKILVIDLSFTKNDLNKQGLLQYLSNTIEKPIIDHGEHFDLIQAGGITRFANELFSTDKFKKLIESYQNDYDWILAVSDTSIFNAESQTLLNIFPKTVISLHDETFQDLQANILQQSILKSFIMT